MELIQEWRSDARELISSREGLAEIRQFVEAAELRGRVGMFIVPSLMFLLEPHYHDPPWPAEDAGWIQELCGLLAAVSGRADLAARDGTAEELRAALERVKDWWETGCDDNAFVASLMIFVNDGPYYGEVVPTAAVGDLPVLDTVELLPDGGQLAFVVAKDSRDVLLLHRHPGGKATWCRRLTTENGRTTRVPAEFSGDFAEFRRGYGWTIGAVAGGALAEGALLHLDPSACLRFFEVSW